MTMSAVVAVLEGQHVPAVLTADRQAVDVELVDLLRDVSPGRGLRCTAILSVAARRRSLP